MNFAFGFGFNVSIFSQAVSTSSWSRLLANPELEVRNTRRVSLGGQSVLRTVSWTGQRRSLAETSGPASLQALALASDWTENRKMRPYVVLV